MKGGFILHPSPFILSCGVGQESRMIKEIPSYLLGPCGWLSRQGQHDDLVVSSRVRIARNIEGLPFSHWASSADLKRIAESCLLAIPDCPSMARASILGVEHFDSLDRKYLVERYLISRELAESGMERFVAVDRGEFCSVMVNEEDHLRLQVLMSGLNLREAWQRVDALDDEMEQRIHYAFSHTYGYLTACPTNAGTGIRCSVMVHLPALVISQRIKKVLAAVTQIGLTVRGLAGEGSEIAGNLFQISNQWTLGASEEETIEKLENILEQIVENERKTREDLWSEVRIALEDKVWRAYGVLSHARIVNSKEALDLLSHVRLGLDLGLIRGVPYSGINDMLVQCRPAHLQKRAGQKLSAQERDVVRGEFLRGWISHYEQSGV